MRKILFQNEYYYHIYNRGVDKRNIFLDNYDYIRFLTSLREFNRIDAIDSLYRQRQIEHQVASKSLQANFACSDLDASRPLVEYICYCLLPNHFHIMVRQITEKGIEKIMHKLGLGYTRYFNNKYARTGSLFQGTYKVVAIKTSPYLYYLSAYIHGNPEIHKLANAKNWTWSSLRDYLDLRKGNLCRKDIIRKEFKNMSSYHEYLNTVIKDSFARKQSIKNYTLE